MKHISDLITKNQSFDGQKTDKKQIDYETAEIVDKIFDELLIIYRAEWGGYFKTQEELDKTKLEWVWSFQDACLHEVEKLRRGIKHARLQYLNKFPHVAQFISWCTTPQTTDLDSFGFPDVASAYRISIELNRQFSNYKCNSEKVERVIRHAIRQIDSTLYRQMPDAKAKEVFQYHYMVSFRQFTEGMLGSINKAIQDESILTEEKSKQKALIKEEYKNVTNKKSALETMKALLQ